MLRRTIYRAQALLAKRAAVLVAIAAAVYVPADFVFAWVDETRLWGDVSALDVTLGLAVYSLAGGFANAACIAALGDETLEVASALWRASRRVLTLVVLTLVISAGVGLGMLALIVPGILLIVWWWVAYQATMLEDMDWRQALGRSRELTRGHFWPVLAVAFGSVAGHSLVEYVLVLRVGNSFLTDFWSAWLLGGLTDVLTLPVGVAVTTALYFELAQARSSAPDPAAPLRPTTEP